MRISLKRTRILLVGIAFLLFILLLNVSQAEAVQTVFTVTNANDDGPGSLRQAIADANASAGSDTVEFDIPGAGPHTIQPASALPEITDPLVIDGTTEPDFTGMPVIELDGINAGNGVHGFTITAGTSTIRGLVINRFGGSAIFIITNGSNIFEGNFLGTDITGTVVLGNDVAGVFIENTADNMVGGTNENTRNVISGNGDGIRIAGSAATANKVQGNFIGTDGAGNFSLGNTRHGVRIDSSASDNIIGGMMEGARNVISGNEESGVYISGSGTTANQILGNLIGTDVTGTQELGNSNYGVGIADSASSNMIGDVISGAGNIISSNGFSGIAIKGFNTTANLIQGNLIGTDITGIVALRNSVHGVLIEDACSNVIGGIDPNAANTIAFNSADGVRIVSGLGNAIRSNAIFSNIDLGIDIGNNGLTSNDSSDADSGANNLQNFPEIISSRIDNSGDLLIQYKVDSDPSHSTYPLAIQFFKSDPDGQGKTLFFDDVYSAINYTKGAKILTVENAAGFGIISGETMVATAIDASGNTSEFSSIALVDTVLAFVVNSIGDEGDSNPGDNICDDGSANCTLRAAIEEANASAGKDSIAFDIAGSGPQPIQPASALPTITDPIIIDGTTISAFAGTPIVEIDGSNAAAVNGLWITAGNSTVRGLVINRFDSAGIRLEVQSDNFIYGNYIGTDIAGTAAAANGTGIVVLGGKNFIGGGSEGAGNLISGNSNNGIFISGDGANGNLIRGNLIGTQSDGVSPLGNNANGIFIAASHNLVGRYDAVGANIIAFNNGAGVVVESGSHNSILANSVFNNASLGIDLNGDRVTANDPGDADTGPNDLQNFPEILEAGLNNQDLVLKYRVDSGPGNSFYPLTIQFFKTDADGEGKVFLGQHVYTISSFGEEKTYANLGNAAALEISAGDSIVATATDSMGSTSEFSPITVIGNITSVPTPRAAIPEAFLLHQNYPNPFNPETVIRFQLPESSDVVIKIFNILGAEIRTLADKKFAAGIHSVGWDGKDKHGNLAASGIYFYKINAAGFSDGRKMVLLR